jgi:1-acyl-sn-glycerol-3-phosphate acyltransferase
MILMDKREQVIRNISRCANSGRLNDKVEVDDPQLTPEQRADICRWYAENHDTHRFAAKRRAAEIFATVSTRIINRDTRIEGVEKLEGITSGGIVTSNHFSPVDNTVVRTMVFKTGRRRLPIVCQDTNYAMTALFGFLMRYADTIPITADRTFMKTTFMDSLRSYVDKGEFVLVYPEQEMWFNYRKPRTGKRGAYLFAAELGVPVISCFVEIVDLDDLQAPNFVNVSYVMHVLDPIFPDPEKSVRQNSIEMCQLDYEQKKRAYEQVYGKKLDYTFEKGDVAGWVPTEEELNLVLTPDELLSSIENMTGVTPSKSIA